MLDRHTDPNHAAGLTMVPTKAPSPTIVMDSPEARGEKKGQATSWLKAPHHAGRKRRISDEDDYADADYVPSAPHQPTKRPHTTHSEAPDDRQLQLVAGCTDEYALEHDGEPSEQFPLAAATSSSSSSTEGDDLNVPLPPPRTWVAKVEWALKLLGGKGTLADIYAVIEDAFPEEVDGKRNWKAAIRSCLSKNEKNKFIKPSQGHLASKDHLWCLATPRPRPPVKRGRPAGRGRRASRSSAPNKHEDVDHHPPPPPHHHQRPSAPSTEVPQQQQEQEPSDADRRDALLLQKQQLEGEITCLLHDMSQDGENGLSADQEDFLRELLG